MADTATLMPPNAFQYVRDFFRQDAGPQSCDPAMPACGDAAKIDVRDVEAAIAHPDVQAALAMTTVPFYCNRGFADGPNFKGDVLRHLHNERDHSALRKINSFQRMVRFLQ